MVRTMERTAMEKEKVINPLVERIEQELRLQGKSQAMLCKHLNLPRQSFTKWKNGDADIPRKHLKGIAEYLEMTVDELINEQCRRVSQASITPMERVILRCYRALDDAMREWFITTLRLATKESLRPSEDRVKSPKSSEDLK